MVLIDLAQLGGVSVRTPSESLVRLLADSENLCPAATHAPPTAAPLQQSGSPTQNGAAVSDLRADSNSRSRNSAFNFYLASEYKTPDGRRMDCASGSVRSGRRKDLRLETEQRSDSGAQPRHSQPACKISQRESVGGAVPQILGPVLLFGGWSR